MKKKLKARVLSALISASMVLTCIPSYAVPLFDGAVNQQEKQDESQTDTEVYDVFTPHNATLNAETEIEGDAAAYKVINERFTVDGIVYKEIGPEKAQLFDASGVVGEFQIPKTVTSKKTGEVYEVVSVHPSAFQDNKKLTSIEISSVFENLEGNFFEGCINLGEVVILTDDTDTAEIEGVTKIGKNWFKNSGIQNIYVDGELIEIDDSAFENCDQLEYFEVPMGVERIGKKAFAECDKLKDVYAPGTLEFVDDASFINCKMLNHFIANASSDYYLKVVGDSAFRYCSSLTNMIPAEKIGAYAFADCININSVQIYPFIKYIGKYAFSKCGITEVLIGNSLEVASTYTDGENTDIIEPIVFEEGTFAECRSLSAVYVNSSDVESGWFTEIPDYMC